VCAYAQWTAIANLRPAAVTKEREKKKFVCVFANASGSGIFSAIRERASSERLMRRDKMQYAIACAALINTQRARANEREISYVAAQAAAQIEQAQKQQHNKRANLFILHCPLTISHRQMSALQRAE
jgi:diacylglycerol kinase family enzyme